MKKVIAMLLVVLLVFVFTSCGEGNTANDKSPAEVRTNSQKQQIEATGDKDEEPSESVVSSSNDANITESVIFDANDIKVTAKSISYDGWLGPELVLLIENNSSQNIIVQTRNVSVNGLMIDPIFSADVVAGKKTNDKMTIMSSELEFAGITTIKNIEFILHIFNKESWDKIIDSDVIVLTTDATEYVQAYDDSGIVAYDEDGIKIVAKKLNSSDSILGADLYLYIENNSKQDITVQVRDVSVNGFMVDPVFSSKIVHDKKAFDRITFLESDLTDNGITDIKEIELRFHIFDTTSWEKIKNSDIVTISFN